VLGAVAGAKYSGWNGLLESQRDYLDDFWDCADVEVEGDADCQQAVRFGLFHVLQASARGRTSGDPGKGLTGTGYDGHTFWDTEGFVLPVLTYTAPYAAADALRWRASTLDLARERAAELDLAGAAFPWRTIQGQECSAYWPAGTAAWHINADIAMAFERYRVVTGDDSLEADCGLTVLVETARLWMSWAITTGTGSGISTRHGFPTSTPPVVRDQRLHQSDGRAQPSWPRRRPAADIPTRPMRWGLSSEETARMARCRRRGAHPLRRRARRTSTVRGLHQPAGMGLHQEHVVSVALHEAYVRLYPLR